MKAKILFIAIALFTGMFGLNAQSHYKFAKNTRSVSAINKNMIGHKESSNNTTATVVLPKAPLDPNAVSIIDLGTSANAYGFGYGGGQKTIIYYNGDLNTITNFHRMGGALDPGGYSGDAGYDVSTDGGQTWTNMVECYVATEPYGQYYADAIRYPQAVIYNPAGNTDPTNAWVSFFGPNLDATNGTWGGYSYGLAKIGATSNVDTTKNLQGSAGEYYQYIPDGMDINRVTGTVLVADRNEDWATGSVVYTGELLISRGVWSEEAGDIVYEKILIDAPVVNMALQARPANIKVAYSPDGATAWIVLLCDNGNNEPVIENQKTYYPVLYKSEDDGETWSDPINVQMDGPDGLPGVLNYMTDEQWDELFVDPDPLREEVPFTTSFDCDLVIDANGNPHIAVAVGVGDLTAEAYTIGSGHPYFCLMDIYTPDGGDTWAAIELGRPENFRGTFGDLTEDNRICTATNWSGTKVFFSWLDTDDEVSNTNNSPDIWARGFDPIANMKTADGQGLDLPTNVTFGSSAMWQAYFGTMSSYVIQDGDSYTLPLVYEQMTPEDPGAAVQFKYIKDFSFEDADFTIDVGPVGLNAYFTADQINCAAGDTIQFTDLSTGNPTSWAWSFEGGQPSTSSEQNPEVVYNTAGDYDVQLSVMDGNGGSDILLKEDFIHVVAELHFNPNWTGNPISPMTVTVMAAELNSLDLQAGDEIAVFDGEHCVGAATLSQTIDPNNNASYIYIACSKDDSDTPEVDGYTPGNTLIYKMFDQSLNMETSSVSAEFPYAPNFMSETFIENETIIVELEGSSGYFEPVWSGNPLNPMSITITKAELDNLALQPGDEIGIFDGDYCVGAEVLQESIDVNTPNTYVYIACAQDDPDTPEIDGFTVGNTISYRVYDLSEEFESASISVVYPYAPQYDFTEFIINETNIVQLNALSSITQTIDLSSGWNLVSWNISPEDMNIQNMLQSLIDENHLVKVIDQNGDILQHMPWGWVNNIGDMANPEGYQIKVSSDCQLSNEGPAVELPLTIPLISGFNLIGWPAQSAEDAETAFADIISSNQLLKVIDENGNILQHMPWGWVNNIGNLLPGEGYQVKVSSSCSLIVNEPSSGGKALKADMPQAILFQPQSIGNPYNPMAFAIQLNNNLPNGAELAVFEGERCLGAAVVAGEYLYLSAGMDEAETTEIEGFTEGGDFSFRYRTAEMSQSEMLSIAYLEGDKTFAERGTFVGELKESLEVEDYSEFTAEIWPNPVRDKLHLELDLPMSVELRCSIWSTQGNRVFETKTNMAHGKNSVVLDISKIVSGLYFLEIEANSEQGIEVKQYKMIKM